MKPFANLSLKLLALLLGFGVWYALAFRSGPASEEWSLEVPLRVTHDPAFMVTERSHEKVVVHGRGAMPPLGTLVYTVALETPTEGRQVLQLSPRAVQEPPGAHILSVAPAAVEIVFDRRAEKSVPIKAPDSLAAGGLRVEISPREARLSGPKGVLAGIRSVVLPPFTLLEAYPQTTVMTLTSPHPQVEVLAPREVVVLVREARP
jgi:hypothetical protein